VLFSLLYRNYTLNVKLNGGLILVNMDSFMEGFILSLSMSLKNGSAKEEELIEKIISRGFSKEYAVTIVEEAKKKCK